MYYLHLGNGVRNSRSNGADYHYGVCTYCGADMNSLFTFQSIKQEPLKFQGIFLEYWSLQQWLEKIQAAAGNCMSTVFKLCSSNFVKSLDVPPQTYVTSELQKTLPSAVVIHYCAGKGFLRLRLQNVKLLMFRLILHAVPKNWITYKTSNYNTRDHKTKGRLVIFGQLQTHSSQAFKIDYKVGCK